MNLSNITKDLETGIPYSVIVDESTDLGNIKSLAIAIRYFKSNIVPDRFLAMIEITDHSADGLFQAIIKTLQQNKIPIQQLVGFAADNASVMKGKNAGLQSKLKELVPKFFVMGCICHSFALCSEAACKKLPDKNELFDRDVCNYFGKSSTRRFEFSQHQQICDLAPHKLLKLSQTRWLSLEVSISLKNVCI